MDEHQLNDAMRQLLAELATLSHGGTSAWNSSGGARGKPGSVLLHNGMIGEIPHEHYHRAYNQAIGAAKKRAVYHEAKGVLDEWRGRSGRARPAGETVEEEESRIVTDGEGFDAQSVATRFYTTVTRVRRLRLASGRDVETGKRKAGMVALAKDGSPERVALLAAQGMSVRQIAMVTGASKSTISRIIRRAV